MPEFDGRSGGNSPITVTFARYENGKDLCTMHPEEPTEEKRLTAWITAKQGSYVSVAEWR